MKTTEMKALAFKPSVKINGRHFDPEIRAMIDAVRSTCPEVSDGTVWVTSANDSTHMKNSKHYVNEAFDVRTRNVMGGPEAILHWVRLIKENLGDDYDVVLEKDHIHVEYDPK